MAGRTIELPNKHGHPRPIAMHGLGSNALHIPAEPSFDRAYRSEWHGMEPEIDQQESTQEARRNTRWRLTKSLRSATLAELAASIAHQVNDPLTSMLANAQAAKRWLRAEPPNMMEALASIDRIARDARAAGQTMGRIRALFTQESLEKSEASVPDMMTEAILLIMDDPNKRKVPIKWHGDENLPTVRVDPLAIQEVFINLISNAIEALENKISPLVGLRAAVNHQNEIVIQVIDNGPGIEETEKIFDAFVTTKKTGLGIGLAVARSIAEAHRGRLWAENNPSGGATFCLALPLGSRNQASAGR